ncbi:MAG: 5'-methylthioadenosine/S-adenosylhomocysteine nucleosidase, partial [Lutibacter sp.]|nr:5'-methylthioadenosine/S-adenosylhomocysteine nucleosidase [Lutibacter sp.]
QHDLNAFPFYEKFEIPILRKKFLETNDSEKLLTATNLFLNTYHEFIEIEDSQLFDIQLPKVVHGDIASGDQFISSLKKIKKLNKKLPTAICVEMEGAAVAQVCFEYEVPFSIIRVISDKANDNATIDFPKFANSIASKYALGILKNYFA